MYDTYIFGILLLSWRIQVELIFVMFIYYIEGFNMTGKYQTGKLHKWVLENQKTYISKLLGNMGRTSDPMGQTREMDTWATSLG